MILNVNEIKKICDEIINRWNLNQNNKIIIYEIIDLLTRGRYYGGANNSIEFSFPVFHRSSFGVLKFYSFNSYSQPAPFSVYRRIHSERISKLKKIVDLLKKRKLFGASDAYCCNKILDILADDITPVNMGLEMRRDGSFRLRIYGNFHRGSVCYSNSEMILQEGKERQIANIYKITKILDFDFPFLIKRLDLNNQKICFCSVGFDSFRCLGRPTFKIYLMYHISLINFPPIVNAGQMKKQIELIKSFSRDLLLMGIEFAKNKTNIIETYGFPQTKNIKEDLSLIKKLIDKYKFNKYYSDIVDFHRLLNNKAPFFLFVVGLKEDNLDFGFNPDTKINKVFTDKKFQELLNKISL